MGSAWKRHRSPCSASFWETESLGFFSTRPLLFLTTNPLWWRASLSRAEPTISPLFQAPLHHLLSLFQPSSPQEQNNNNKPNWEKTREVCPHFWNPLKGCYWKRIQKCMEGFCVSFSGSVGRSLCTRSGETGMIISARKPLISGHQQEDLASCLSCLWIQRFWKDPKWGLWLSSVLLGFIFFPLPLPAALFSVQRFSSVAHSNPSSWYRSRGSWRPGYLGVEKSLTEQVTRVIHRNRFLGKSPDSNHPPQLPATLPFQRGLFLLVPEKPVTETPGAPPLEASVYQQCCVNSVTRFLSAHTFPPHRQSP